MSFEPNDRRIQVNGTYPGNFHAGNNAFSQPNNQGPIGNMYSQNVPNPFTSTVERTTQLRRAFDALQLFIKTKQAMENMTAGDWYQNASSGFFCQAVMYAPQSPKAIYDAVTSWDTTGFPQGVLEILEFVKTTAKELFTQEHN